jgi:hypothetical protein
MLWSKSNQDGVQIRTACVFSENILSVSQDRIVHLQKRFEIFIWYEICIYSSELWYRVILYLVANAFGGQYLCFHHEDRRYTSRPTTFKTIWRHNPEYQNLFVKDVQFFRSTYIREFLCVICTACSLFAFQCYWYPRHPSCLAACSILTGPCV